MILSDGTTSSIVKVTSGVPQGAILSPYLFASHMGSLKTASNRTEMIKFADDVAIAIPYRSNSDVEQRLACESANMKDLCENNGLVLNEEKTKIMLIDKRNDKEGIFISSSDTMKILGVTFQSNLKWDTHIDLICKTAAQRIYLLKEMKKLSIPKNDMILVYKSHIQSVLEYNAPLFVGLTMQNSSILKKLRKRAHRVICGTECDCDALASLLSRREARALAFFKTMLEENHILHHLCPTILPRTKHVSIPYSRTDRRAKSFIPVCSILYNRSLTKS